MRFIVVGLCMFAAMAAFRAFTGSLTQRRARSLFILTVAMCITLAGSEYGWWPLPVTVVLFAATFLWYATEGARRAPEPPASRPRRADWRQ